MESRDETAQDGEARDRLQERRPPMKLGAAMADSLQGPPYGR